MAAKFTLEIEPDYDFEMIGISSHVKDYRLCWAIKKVLSVDFKKIDSLEIKGKKQTTSSYFSMFHCEDEVFYRDYYILANLSENKELESEKSTLFVGENAELTSFENEWLIPEQKQMNFFFILKGEVDEEEIVKLLSEIKALDFVLTAKQIDVSSLKSKKNLLF